MPNEPGIPPKDPAEPIEEMIRSVQIEVLPPDSYVYSNVAGLSLTPWDIRIHFADVSPSQEDLPKYKASVGIVMPPEHAAGLMFLLMDQLKHFERNSGPIRLARWQAMVAGALKRAEAEKSDQATNPSQP